MTIPQYAVFDPDDLAIVPISGLTNAAAGMWYLGDPTAAAFTVNLPSAPVDGAPIRVENIGTANVITVARSGTDTIEGATSFDVVVGAYAEFTYRKANGTWRRRRYTPDPVPGNMRRDLAGRAQVVDPLALPDIVTLRTARALSDLELSDRAADHAPGPMNGVQASTGQPWISAGYTATNNDSAAFPRYIGTGDAARISTTGNGTPLGVFAQAQMPDQVRHMRGRWTINPNTTNGGGTAGTANTGTVGLIAWEPNFGGNPSSPPQATAHCSFSATDFTFAVIYQGVLYNIYTYTYGLPLAQDGTTIHSAEWVVDHNAVNNSGGKGIAYVYAPDGTVHEIHNNVIGAVTTATVATFEIYKSAAGQRLAEFVDIGVDSRRTDRILRARREFRQGGRQGTGIVARPSVSYQLPDGISALAAGGAATSGRTTFWKFDSPARGLRLSGMACNVTTAQSGGTVLCKGAVYLDFGDGGGPRLEAATAGLLAQCTMPALTSTGWKVGSFGTNLWIPPHVRVWFALFYYASAAPTTSPVFQNATSMLSVYSLTNAAAAKGLWLGGTTDLPTGSQTLSLNSDVLGGLVAGVPA